MVLQHGKEILNQLRTRFGQRFSSAPFFRCPSVASCSSDSSSLIPRPMVFGSQPSSRENILNPAVPELHRLDRRVSPPITLFQRSIKPDHLPFNSRRIIFHDNLLRSCRSYHHKSRRSHKHGFYFGTIPKFEFVTFRVGAEENRRPCQNGGSINPPFTRQGRRSWNFVAVFGFCSNRSRWVFRHLAFRCGRH